jgi:hypothetical protein
MSGLAVGSGLSRSVSERPRRPLDRDGDGRDGGSLPSELRGLSELKAQLKAAGVKVDRRWGERRMLQELSRIERIDQ